MFGYHYSIHRTGDGYTVSGHIYIKMKNRTKLAKFSMLMSLVMLTYYKWYSFQYSKQIEPMLDKKSYFDMHYHN